jgi:hypothetical protein
MFSDVSSVSVPLTSWYPYPVPLLESLEMAWQCDVGEQLVPVEQFITWITNTSTNTNTNTTTTTTTSTSTSTHKQYTEDKDNHNGNNNDNDKDNDKDKDEDKDDEEDKKEEKKMDQIREQIHDDTSSRTSSWLTSHPSVHMRPLHTLIVPNLVCSPSRLALLTSAFPLLHTFSFFSSHPSHVFPHLPLPHLRILTVHANFIEADVDDDDDDNDGNGNGFSDPVYSRHQ